MAKLLDAPNVEYELITRSEHYHTIYHEPEHGCFTADLLAQAFCQGMAGLDAEITGASIHPLVWVDARWFEQHHTHPSFRTANSHDHYH